ncbi:MAG: alpha/beta hydrolase [Saprospiraceae bacterium]|nr:alpha/beta hydrolase [Saprospiraceae bacterium]
MQNSFEIDLAAGTVHVHQWGTGPEVILALHGFRQSGLVFAKTLAPSSDRFTIVAPDLPFHGRTVWDQQEYTPHDLEQLCWQLINKMGVQNFTLAGFSLGGQLACGLAIRGTLPINRLILLAPDTPATKWGWFTFGIPYASRKALQRLFNRIGDQYRWLERLYQFRILDRFTYYFLRRNLAEKAGRNQLFGTWRARGYFQSTFRNVAQLPIPVHIHLGQEDPLIPAQKIKQKWNMLDVNLHATGHNILQDFSF